MSHLKRQFDFNNEDSSIYYPYQRNDSPHLIGGFDQEPHPLPSSAARNHSSKSLGLASSSRKGCPLQAPRPLKSVVSHNLGYEPTSAMLLSSPSCYVDLESFDDNSNSSSSGENSPESNDSEEEQDDIQSELNKIFSTQSNYDNFDNEILDSNYVGKAQNVFDDRDFDWPGASSSCINVPSTMSPRLPKSNVCLNDDMNMPVLGASPAPINNNANGGPMTEVRPPSRAPNPFTTVKASGREMAMKKESSNNNGSEIKGNGGQGGEFSPVFLYFRNRSYSEPMIFAPLHASSQM